MLLLVDTGLDDLCVESVGNERDDEVVLANLSLERCGIVDVERDGCGVLQALGELLGALECSAGFVLKVSHAIKIVMFFCFH